MIAGTRIAGTIVTFGATAGAVTTAATATA